MKKITRVKFQSEIIFLANQSFHGEKLQRLTEKYQNHMRQGRALLVDLQKEPPSVSHVDMGHAPPS